MLNGRTVIISIIFLLIGFICWYFSNIISFILVAYVLSLIGHPIVILFEKVKIKNFRIPRTIVALLTLAVLWVVFYYFLKFFLPLIATQALKFSDIDLTFLVDHLQHSFNRLEVFINKINIGKEQSFLFENYVLVKMSKLLDISFFTVLFDQVVSLLGDIFIAILAISFITFFFLKDSDLFTNSILLLVPNEKEERVKHVMDSIQKLLSRYFVGILIESLLILTLVASGFRIIGFNFNDCLLLGLVAGVLNVIPYVGPLISILFGLLMGMVSYTQYQFPFTISMLVIYILAIYAIVKVIDDVIFQPYIYSSSVNAHPLEIFLVILIAGSMAGIIGMLLAVPSYTIVRVIAKEFFSHFKVVQKMTQKIDN
jgi:predicted PurR-regulated permease PerM